MEHRLIIVEGLPCSGKSSISAYIAQILKQRGNVRYVDEGTGDHPADYEFHALAPEGLLGAESRIVPLALVSGDQLERLLPYKIYDGLPWAMEKPLMLDKWRTFVREADPDAVYVFNCVLLQNPMCETMMRFNFEERISQNYIEEIAQIIREMNPLVIYLKNEDVADSVRKAAQQRTGWLDAVIHYHVNGAYGRHIGAQGFEGYICCLQERQRREINILTRLPVSSIVLENPQRNWLLARDKLMELICG